MKINDTTHKGNKKKKKKKEKKKKKKKKTLDSAADLKL